MKNDDPAGWAPFAVHAGRLTVILILLFAIAPPAFAALYSPGQTLDPACAPTDPGCGISTVVASSTANSIPYYAANGSILSATSTVTILQNGNVGIGTSSPVGQLDLENYTVNTDGGTLTGGNPQLEVNGTLDTTNTIGHVTGAQLYWNTIGTGSQNVNGMRMQLNTGYTGSGLTRVADFQNNVQGTHSLGIADTHGNFGISAEAQGGATDNSTVGDNVGVYAIANGSQNVNVAVYGRSFNQAAGQYTLANIGVIGVGGHFSNNYASTSEIGGFFAAGANGNWYNELATTSTALLLDNEAENVPILIGRVNGTNAFTINNIGGITSTSTTNSVNFWQVFNSSGTTLFNLDTANMRVGVGTTTPYADFSVQNDYGSNNSSLFSIGSSTASDGSSASTFLTVTNAGLVGIGTTTPIDNLVVSSQSSAATLGVISNGNSAGSGNVRFDLTNGDGNKYALQYAGSGNTVLKLQYDGATEDVFNTNGSFTVAGNGSAAPGSVLQANGVGYFSTSTNLGNLIALSTSNGNFGFISTPVVNTWSLGYGGPTASLGTLGTSVLYWNTSGNVGIGTTTPYALLSISNSVSTAANTPLFVIASTTAGTATTTVFKIDSTGSATFTGSGGTCVINGSGNCTSDARLKTNITEIPDALAGIEQINGVTYNWLDPSLTQSQQMGVIAQDVLKVFPQLVGTVQTSLDGVSGTYYTVNYAGLVAPLIEAVKEIASISGDFKTNLIAWLGSAGNGIGDIFANNLHAQSELCVGGTCITGAQLQELMQNAGQASASQSPSPIIITNVPVVSSTTTSSTDATASSTDSSGAGAGSSSSETPSTVVSTSSDTITSPDISASTTPPN